MMCKVQGLLLQCVLVTLLLGLQLTQGKYCPAKSIGVGLTDIAAVHHTGQIYVVGRTHADQDDTFHGTTFEYDLGSDQWLDPTKKKLLETKEQRLLDTAAHSAEIVGNKMYIIGGAGSNSEAGNTMQFLSLQRVAHWQEVSPDLPYSAAGISTAVLKDSQGNDEIYICGGIDQSKDDNRYNKAIKHCYTYKPKTNKYQKIEPLVQAVGFASACTDKSHMYVIGGRSELSPTSEAYDIVQRYDPFTKKWTIEDGKLPEPRSGAGRCVVQHTGKVGASGTIYVFGGTDGTKIYNNYVAFSTTEGDWREETGRPMSIGRYGIDPVMIGDAVFIVGGSVSLPKDGDVDVEITDSVEWTQVGARNHLNYGDAISDLEEKHCSKVDGASVLDASSDSDDQNTSKSRSKLSNIIAILFVIVIVVGILLAGWFIYKRVRVNGNSRYGRYKSDTHELTAHPDGMEMAHNGGGQVVQPAAAANARNMGSGDYGTDGLREISLR